MAAKQVFNIPYVGVDKTGSYDLLVGQFGECSVIISMTNPIIRYSASPDAYDEFHHLIINMVKILGDGYILQKQDIITRAVYPLKQSDEYLQRKYFEHFAGRDYLDVKTYLTITKAVKKNKFQTYDPKGLVEFRQAVEKVIGILERAKAGPGVLKEPAINLLVMQILAMNFNGDPISLNNVSPNDTELVMGDLHVRNISLVNIDNIDLPQDVGTFIELNESETLKGFPVDFLSFLFKVPGFKSILFNQVIEIPGQIMTLQKLELKKKRHSGIPDPANRLCMEDIDLLLNDVARENQLLVNCHFNIVIAATKENVQKACNFIESALFQLGIIPSRNAYNQLELFRTALPGNGVELKPYDWFLTTCDAAACFFFKETNPKDEPSDFLVRFTDRQGVPVGIDPADLPMRTNRINNRNMFVCGPSGSGKSFFMSSLIEQLMLYNMDIVIIDVGHSYSGLCAYHNGKYITYAEDKPITMNPFLIAETEFNIEKKDFLVTLIALAWKGNGDTLSTIERDVISSVISGFFSESFTNGSLLNFNAFYEFAVNRIPIIIEAEKISFALDEFRYVLKKFYKGGEFDTILNQDGDESLFNERFIVFEIDSIKDHFLFPLVTVIIMDVFIQKMRHRKSQRKTLILEEAWKALGSPVMANFLLYLNKTVRKFWGALIPVTQEINDMLGNAIIKDSLISNTDTICLLDQSKFRDNYKDIAALLSINETERRKIFTINQLDNTANRGRFKEVYIRRGSTGEVYGVEVSLEQYLTYTTEKPEKSAVEVYTNAYGSYPAGLDAFIADLDESKLQLGEFVSRTNRAGVPAHSSF